ncbi:MAG: isoamylase early set domain-containing protein [Planctomycetota bacterium]|nr:isoamylase early set domain-containing protein [Planctomycetota bacterium]
MVTIDGEWVSFSFYRPSAKAVHLSGDFNSWDESTLPMRAKAGYWTARMRLPAGEFRFRYLADGEWFTDYAAFGVEPSDFGLDSVLRVPPLTLKVGEPVTQSESAAA